MNIMQQRALIQRWQALDAALITLVTELRASPATAHTVDVLRHPAYETTVGLMADIMRKLSAPAEPVYYVLLLLDDGDRAPSVMQAIRCDGYEDHMTRYTEFRADLNTTPMGSGALPTPDGGNEFNAVTVMQLDPEEQT